MLMGITHSRETVYHLSVHLHLHHPTSPVLSGDSASRLNNTLPNPFQWNTWYHLEKHNLENSVLQILSIKVHTFLSLDVKQSLLGRYGDLQQHLIISNINISCKIQPLSHQLSATYPWETFVATVDNYHLLPVNFNSTDGLHHSSSCEFFLSFMYFKFVGMFSQIKEALRTHNKLLSNIQKIVIALTLPSPAHFLFREFIHSPVHSHSFGSE